MSSDSAAISPQLQSALARCEASLEPIIRAEPLAAPHARYAFETLGALGEGGMGQVIRIRDRRLGREAALKMMHEEKPERRQRFLREARITAALDHPAIPPVYEAGVTSEGRLYLLMRLIDGRTLGEIVAEDGRGELRERLQILIKVCEAAAYAHSRGVIHRDIKPDNVMVGGFGEVLLMDWGIARLPQDSESQELFLPTRADSASRAGSSGSGSAAEHDPELTRAGTMVGTPGYASPEQLAGDPVDARADVFSLGCLLTELATGERAITGSSTIERVAQASSGMARSPRQVDSSIPRDLDAIARAALAPDPKDRTASAQVLADQLQAWLAGELVPGVRYSPAARLRRALRRRAELIIVAMAVTLGLGAGAAVWVTAEARARRAEETLAAFNLARSLERRAAPVEEVRRQVEVGLSASGRSENALLTAAEIYEDARLFADAETLLREASERFKPAYEALFAWHRIQSRELIGLHFTPAMRELMKRSRAAGDVNEYTLFTEYMKVFESGDKAAANALLEQLEGLAPGMPEVLNARGASLLKAERFEEALAVFDKLLTVHPDYPVALANRAFGRERVGRLEEAAIDLDRAIGLAPNSAAAYNTRGMVRDQLGDDAGALKDLDRALELDPKMEAAYTNRALLLQDLGELDRSADDFEKALELNPDSAPTRASFGHLLRRMGEWDEARQQFQRALQKDPESSSAWYGMACVHEQVGATSQALEAYAQAIETSAERAVMLSNRATFFEKLRRYEDALRDYEEALRLNSQSALTQLGYGNALYQLGRSEASLQAFDAALAIDPGLVPALASRAALYNRMGQKDRALRDLDEALRRDSANVGALANRASILRSRGDLDAALRDAQRAVDEDNASVAALLARALIQRDRGLPRAAVADLERVLELDPNHPLAADISQLIQTLKGR